MQPVPGGMGGPPIYPGQQPQARAFLLPWKPSPNRMARNRMARKEPTYSDLVQHAAYVLDNPLDNAAMMALADHLVDAYPNHPLVQGFTNWTQGGLFHENMRDMRTSRYTAYRPPTSYSDIVEDSFEVRPRHNTAGQYLYGENLTPEDRALPIFRRVYGQPLWQRRKYRDNIVRGELGFNSTVPVRRKPATSTEVAHALLTHGGPESLIHAVMGNRFFHPGNRNPDTGLPQREVRFMRGDDRRTEKPQATRMSRRGRPRRFSMSTEAGFHRYLHDHPEDTTAALAYADYLEDNGKPTHAEIIRRNVNEHGDGAVKMLGGTGWSPDAAQGKTTVFINDYGQDPWRGIPPQYHAVNLRQISLTHPEWLLAWGTGVGTSPEETNRLIHGLISEGAEPRVDTEQAKRFGLPEPKQLSRRLPQRRLLPCRESS